VCLILLFGVAVGCSVAIPSDNSPLYKAYQERTALISEMKSFEREIGYRATKNFLSYSDRNGYPICYYTATTYLPHSVMDFFVYDNFKTGRAGEIDVSSEEQCRAGEKDVFFYRPEAIAGIGGTPVTPPMLEAPMGRFLNLVFHEDFHDQFNRSRSELPRAIEEAAAGFIGLEAARQFALNRFGKNSPEFQAAEREFNFYDELLPAVNQSYDELKMLYARHKEGQISQDQMNEERKAVFRKLESRREEIKKQNGMSSRVLWAVNNASLGHMIMYSRNYPLVVRVFHSLGDDLSKTVRFFLEMEKQIPDGKAIRAKAEKLAKVEGKINEEILFIMAKEELVVKMIEKRLLEISKAK